jgi:hypothetical protein
VHEELRALAVRLVGHRSRPDMDRTPGRGFPMLWISNVTVADRSTMSRCLTHGNVVRP